MRKFLMWVFSIKPIDKENYYPNHKGVEIVDLIKEKTSNKLDEKIPKFRRNGTTTRIADNVIQMFFQSKRNEKVTYGDHYFESKSGHDHLRKIVEKRLIEEHGLTKNQDFFSSYDKIGNILIKKF